MGVLTYVDDGSGEAEYLQVARALRQQIIAGEIEVGDPLPSTRAALADFGVGRKTWARAVTELRLQGLVAVRKGQGAWVTARPAVNVVEVTAGDQVATRAATQEERERMGTGPLTSVLVVTRAAGEVEVHSGAVTVCLVV